jgi:hypothetical protein
MYIERALSLAAGISCIRPLMYGIHGCKVLAYTLRYSGPSQHYTDILYLGQRQAMGALTPVVLFSTIVVVMYMLSVENSISHTDL